MLDTVWEDDENDKKPPVKLSVYQLKDGMTGLWVEVWNNTSATAWSKSNEMTNFYLKIQLISVK